MKRTIPLLITFFCGMVLLLAHFSPYTQRWGEVAMIWFDILASIAFLLGGGNLLKVHLQKVFTQQAGWAYSLITVVAFVLTLWVGLVKWAVPPAQHLEHYGESFAPLALKDFPLTYSVSGPLPENSAEDLLPASVRSQLSQTESQWVFRGWLLPNQRADLLTYKDQLAWKCLVEQLAEVAQPPARVRGKVAYYPDQEVLAFRGSMSVEERAELEGLSDQPTWQAAVAALYEAGQCRSEVVAEAVPPRFTPEQARGISPALEFEPGTRTLRILGPMSLNERDALFRQFPLARPMPRGSPQRQALWKALQDRGPLSPEQEAAFHAQLDRTWTVAQLLEAVRVAGRGETPEKTACQMLTEKQQGALEIQAFAGRMPDQKLTSVQESVIQAWAGGDTLYVKDLLASLAQVSGGQVPTFAAAGIENFCARLPLQAEQNKAVCQGLLRVGPLTDAQRDYLLEAYRDQWAWRLAVDELFRQAHPIKFPWSGQYNAPGSPFWWIYEYMFKPLTATMFSLLAFYVASAAFRAFRAKNVEATLLLATAFIVLLGRTAAGTVVTGWLPDWLGWLRVEELTVVIMSVFNTAGTRAIMIGIALGIAATSLKVLLGMDRSYLGSGDK